MSFIPKQYDDGKLQRMPVAAATFNKGDTMVDDGAGFLTPGAAGTAVDVKYVAMETVSTTPTQGDLHLMIRTEGVIFEADTDANPARTDVGTFCDLASASTVNPDASTNDVFYIEDIVGAVGDNKVRGYFATGVPNS